jgi:acylphosphatase
MTAGQDRARLHLILGGRVHGVFFRYACVDEAQKLGLTGWVRNLASGEVEIVAEGGRRNLELLLAWARVGPPRARVTAVHEEWSEFANEFSGFRVR